MKGIIVCCLAELVTKRFGEAVWKKCLTEAGLDSSTVLLPISNVDDSTFKKILSACGQECGLSTAQAADAFGEYWVKEYSQRLFSHYYSRSASSREFLLDMDEVHVSMTRNVQDANPPRFSYEWKDDNTLLMHYKSNRGLIDFVVGLAKGVGTFYNEPLTVTKLDAQTVKIDFPT
jgi:methyl-accepting chemotaxis protein